MQTSVVVLLALAAAASAQFAQQQFAPQQFGQQQFGQQQFAPQVRAAPVPILNHQHTRDDFGQYAYSYATGDGASHSDNGALKHVAGSGPEDHYVLVRQGTHEYTSPEGRLIKLSYIADENGYRPIGEHLPIPVAAVV